MKKIFTSVYFLYLLPIIAILIGYLLNNMYLVNFNFALIFLFTSFIILKAWVFNPLCSINKKIIYKRFRRPLFQIPFCIPKLIKTKKVFIRKTVIFNTTAKTEHYHINKLFGFSIGDLFEFNSVHNNSYRFGWNYNKELDGINIYSYIYEKNIRFEKLLETIPFNEAIMFTLKKNENNVTFSIFDIKNSFLIKEVVINIDKYNTKKYGYLLGLYYGGKPTAPHKIDLKMW